MTPKLPFDGFGSSLVAPPLHIAPVDRDRERYRDLLLLADEQWDMVERYLHRGDMYVALGQSDLGCVLAGNCRLVSASGDGSDDPARPAPTLGCVSARSAPELGCMIVTDEGVDASGARIAEVKNLAVAPEFQRRGVGRALLDFAAARYSPTHDVLQVGTGDSLLTVPFYESCGFMRSHVLPNFFIDNYDHPIIEAGVQLRDMVYLRRAL